MLYDAVVLLPGEAAAADLASDAAWRDFVADAFAHCKFIGYVAAAEPLLEAAGVAPAADEGLVALDDEGGPPFVEQCRDLRFWDRELLVTTARTVIRRALVAGSCAMLLVGIGVTGCSGGDDSSSGGGGGPASTTQLDDSPTQRPQSGPNPGGGEPVPGSTPAAG